MEEIQTRDTSPTTEPERCHWWQRLPLLPISVLGLFLTLLFIPPTFAALSDHEFSFAQWGTGSLHVEVLESVDPNITPPVEDDNADQLVPFIVQNVGSQPFIYHFVSDEASQTTTACEQVFIEIWKDGEGSTPVLSSPLSELHVMSVHSVSLYLSPGQQALWWYRLTFSPGSSSCQPQLVAQAFQNSLTATAGFQDEAALSLYNPLGNNVLTQNALTFSPQVFEQQLHNDSELLVKQVGSFITIQYLPTNQDLTMVHFQMNYTHIVDGQPVDEVIENDVEPNAFGEFLPPDQYFGECNASETSCLNHQQVGNLTLTMMAYNQQQLVTSQTIPLQWTDQP